MDISRAELDKLSWEKQLELLFQEAEYVRAVVDEEEEEKKEAEKKAKKVKMEKAEGAAKAA